MHVVQVTPALLALLNKRCVYLSQFAEGRWRVGDRIGFVEDCEIEPFTDIMDGVVIPRALGAFSYSYSPFDSRARVGRYCSFAKNIAWMGADHPAAWASTSPAFYSTELTSTKAYRLQYGEAYPQHHLPLPDPTVTIGNDVWIGDEAMIAPGITIGDGAVIGARTLVLDDVPPYAVMVGHPARILRYRFPEALVARFLEAQWWRFPPAALSPLPVTEPERFLDALSELMARGTLKPMTPARLTAKELVAAAAPEGV